MSTYFNVVNLDKKEQASLVVVATENEINEIIQEWEAENYRTWTNEGYAPNGFKKQEDGKWHLEINPYFHSSHKFVFGFIMWSACTDAWGVTGSWYGDRVVIIDDNKSDIRDWEEWYKISETYKKTKFYVSLSEWNDAIPRKKLKI